MLTLRVNMPSNLAPSGFISAENVDQTIPHPLVNIYFGRTYNGLGFPVGVGADPESEYYGQYGYYMVRSSFTSPYGYYWNIHSNNWALYLQDSWTINNKLTINYGLRTESEYIPSLLLLTRNWPRLNPLNSILPTN